MQERKRVWLKHKYKENWDRCPLCQMPLRWVYDDEWVPVDREPILFKADLDGKFNIYTGRKLINNGVIYKNGDTGIFKQGLLPHVYSCDNIQGHHGLKVVRV